MNTLNTVLIIIGAIILVIAGVALAVALPMVGYMSYYHCMGMMCGPMMYYPLVLPITLFAIGAVLVVLPLTALRNYGQTSGAVAVNSTKTQEVSTQYLGNDVLKLLPSHEREVLEYIIKSGGEVYQYQIMRDLGLSKVRAWRIVRRLEEKGLVEVTKVKGRNIVRFKGGTGTK